MIKNQLFIAFALVVGVAIGYFVKGDANITPNAEKGYKPAAHIKDVGVVHERKRVVETVVVTNVVTLTNGFDRHRGPMPGGNPSKWFENMRKNNPQEFVKMTNRMAQMHQRMQARRAARQDFLGSINASGMTQERRENHEKLQQLLSERNEIEDMMRQRDLTDDERREVMENMRQNEGETRKASRIEREALIDETAKELGLDEETSQAFSSTIQEIIEATEVGGHHSPPPPPPNMQ